MDLKNSHFRFNAVLKNEQQIEFEALELFPGLSEISFGSRAFSEYSECVRSCKGMLEDIVRDINSYAVQESRFKVGAEVNPVHTGTETLSKDWGDDEISRFWVYERAMEGNGRQINAICRSSIYAVSKEDSVQHTMN